jgi:uncharacterized MnhB-related membrane protein
VATCTYAIHCDMCTVVTPGHQQFLVAACIYVLMNASRVALTDAVTKVCVAGR